MACVIYFLRSSVHRTESNHRGLCKQSGGLQIGEALLDIFLLVPQEPHIEVSWGKIKWKINIGEWARWVQIWLDTNISNFLCILRVGGERGPPKEEAGLGHSSLPRLIDLFSST